MNLKLLLQQWGKPGTPIPISQSFLCYSDTEVIVLTRLFFPLWIRAPNALRTEWLIWCLGVEHQNYWILTEQDALLPTAS